MLKSAIKPLYDLLCSFRQIFSRYSHVLLCTPGALPENPTPGIAQTNQTDFGVLWNLITLTKKKKRRKNIWYSHVFLKPSNNINLYLNVIVPPPGLWWSRHDPWPAPVQSATPVLWLKKPAIQNTYRREPWENLFLLRRTRFASLTMQLLIYFSVFHLHSSVTWIFKLSSSHLLTFFVCFFRPGVSNSSPRGPLSCVS